MAPSFPAIQAALARFSSDVSAAGIDAHIVMLAGQGICVPPPVDSGQCGVAGGGFGLPTAAPDSLLPNFLHLSVSFGYSQGMSVILDNYAGYRQKLRPDARTHLVLTEDGAPPMSPESVIAHVEGRARATASGPWMPGLRAGAWTFNGVVCKNGISGVTCLTAFQSPATTLSLIESTGGVSADLAEAGQGAADPFASLLQALATKVIVGAELSCEYDIPPAPAGETFDRDRVNVRYGASGQGPSVVPRVDGACNDALAWTYRDANAPSKIVLCPAACTQVRASAGTSLAVEFGCQTTLLR
ncbi:MAG: hypothetical protein RL385_87 [Pseudomonadota bacterium]|jgi:hypothetical protein